jgi:hypothetical protein
MLSRFQNLRGFFHQGEFIRSANMPGESVSSRADKGCGLLSRPAPHCASVKSFPRATRDWERIAGAAGRGRFMWLGRPLFQIPTSWEFAAGSKAHCQRALNLKNLRRRL